MIFKSKTRKRIGNAFKRSSALFMALILLIEITLPTHMFALTSGPSQPEVQSFEPVGTSDMVDLFTGDFNYNIPLLDVDGYPINIAYHSGITMDQEASWVGLGWNINPGVINRNMRGLPDDFAGDNVVKETNMKPNKTWGVAANLDLEIFGSENLGGGIGGSFGFNFNNYTGPSIQQSVNINLSAGISGGGALSGALGISSSSDEGLSVQPSVGFSKNVSDNDRVSATVGVNFNSRGGLKQLTISASGSSSTGEYSYNKAFESKYDFGTPTYTPMINNSMKNHSVSGAFSIGGEIWGVDGKIGVSGFYSSQKLAKGSITAPAYGYLYSEKGQASDNALMDFNREKDGRFTENTACLPVPNFTFDTYSVSGQGVGGSYRPFRGDVGYVFDPAAYTTTDDDALTLEVGAGGYVHVGGNTTVIDISGQSGKWKNGNLALGKLRFNAKGKGNDFENVYFKEANEKSVDDDTLFYSAAGGSDPISPGIDYTNRYEPHLTGFGPVKRTKRQKRSQNFSFLKRSEYNDFAIQPVSNTYSAPANHIAEVTTIGGDGARYVYGIAAYNTWQRETSFSVGSDDLSNVGDRLSGLNGNTGLIDYSAGTDNSSGNLQGIDNYFSRTSTPAYGHSYLLTSVLSADYVDADATRGPSDNDLGNYTRFTYSKISDYQWRTPYETNKASYNEGLKSDLQDDKANYIYGKKELWYLDSVITKNYVAVFHKSNRIDGAGVKSENGGYDTTAKKMMRLDSISLYSKQDLEANPSTALPVKRVHFEYSYDLCQGIPNVTSGSAGKLTLKKIYFTYQNSNKARLSPYIFDYHEDVSSENPDYNQKAYDRWGNYKPNIANYLGVTGQADIDSLVARNIPNSDYPYVNQNTSANSYASVWSLKEIQLPSGGKINMTYESDDYAYVQNKPAGQMFKVIDYGDDTPNDLSNTYVSFDDAGGKFYFALQDGETDIAKYVQGITYVYFRFLVKIRDVMGYDNIEYVSGYGELDGYGIEGGYGYVKMKDVNIKKTGTQMTNPVVKAALQFGRIYMPKKVWTADASGIANMSNQSSLGASILDALVNSDFIKNIKDAIQGPNSSLFDSYDVAHDFVAGKSWLRLVNPTKNKKGGGLRVKKIEMTDEWGDMTTSSQTSNYGQEYEYILDDSTSSGVASYEPMLGGDENPWRQPLFNDIEKLLVPNDEFYQEEPMGESFFPTPSIGYSKVTVKNLARENVTRHATGKVVHEFYTGKDFPTITRRTDVSYDRAKDDPYSISSLLKISVRDYFTASQGFCVELNDMHGKPKAQKVYQEGHTIPVSSVEYKYKKDDYLNGSFKLNNKCTTIAKDGTVSIKTIGEFFDMVADIREDKTETNSVVTAINLDVIPIFGYPIPIPMAWPSFAKEKKRFRSATSAKVIQRFGILEETVAQDLGSIVSTKNLAYDGETGDLLLTQTTTNFNDQVYNFKYPAWWYYEMMGPAYQNIDFEMNSTTFNSSGVASIGSTASYFKEGDELAMFAGTNKKGWVDSVTNTTIRVMDRFGVPIVGNYSFKVIRSGKRNTISTEMATVTTLSNPLTALKSNAYENVLQAGAIEFSNKRKSHCDCITGVGSTLPYTNNPFVSGAKGNWRPLKSYTHLTGRKQSNYDGNTNIRKDGIFASYLPYYKWKAGKWEMSPKDWTYVSEVTEFNVHSEELENKDALGRYSSATFGYNQAMALSVAANSQYKEQGFDGFEDYNFNPCADDHFKWSSVTPSDDDAHTGRYSLKIATGFPKTLTRQIAAACIDSSACMLSIDTTVVDASTLDAEVDNGTAPYSYEWEVISGGPEVNLITAGIEIIGTTYQIELRVTDGKGCIQTKLITR